ncbi:hypothetical protein CP960_03695 [Malaciobacter halophilus]|uniref:PhoP regulatory network protein YrbL n=1 Tax=Malaciobacter halophilus TaxID=197482 RepID=A0A2N1J4U6_9BACT|nr:YrbL family protein [Malaciobacter halophilus]AXH10230.1 YrbL family protein [Malaciobacter halophilus]PKI81570.1 hypothetical protein CP960_03695 [Malaciobacter halophilus]
MNEKVVLSNKYFLAKGGERDCYIHPNDNSKVIKIVHRKGKHNNQNELEYIYNKFLLNNAIPFTHLTKCIGFINTNLGQGLIFDRVLDYNNKQSSSFKDFLQNKLLSNEEENRLVEELKEFIFTYNILFIDVDLSNVFCCEYKKNNYRLVIIDGLGARRTGWRFNLYLKSRTFTKYKIKKQWKKFFKNFQNAKSKIYE